MGVYTFVCNCIHLKEASKSFLSIGRVEAEGSSQLCLLLPDNLIV